MYYIDCLGTIQRVVWNTRLCQWRKGLFFKMKGIKYQSGIRKRGKRRLNRKLNQDVTGSGYPIKIYILGSCDKDGFDMAAGVNLCDVRIEETLKIRIGKSTTASNPFTNCFTLTVWFSRGSEKPATKKRTEIFTKLLLCCDTRSRTSI